MNSHIEITPGICGGKPRIAGHRITVANIATWHQQMGMSAEAISEEYSLPLADVYAALSFYFDHQAEIDRSIQEGQAFVDELKQRTPSLVQQKLHQKNGYGRAG
ncbi:MAG: DUF433 domain-containing protein [Pirellulaceae bacterium]